MERDITSRVPLVSCGVCGGAGGPPGQSCSACGGLGKGLLLGDTIAYWFFPLTGSRVQEERLRSIIRWTIRCLAFAVGVLGILALMLDSIHDVGLGHLPFLLVFKKGPLAFLFWLGVVADCYIFFALDQDVVSGHSLPPRTYEATSAAPATELSVDFSQYKKLNVWNVLAPMARHGVVLAAHNAARQGRAMNSSDVASVALEDDRCKLMLYRLGTSAEAVRLKLQRVVDQQTSSQDSLTTALLFAALRSYEAGQRTIDVPYVLVAIAICDSAIAEALYDLSIDSRKLLNVLVWQQSDERLRNSWRHWTSRARLRPHNRLDRAMTAVATPTIDFFSQDYTEMAQWGRFLPAVRRPDITLSILRVMEGGRGVVIVGEPGVGKGGIIEDIAERMVANEVPAALQDKRLVSISVAKLVSGASPAEAESRLLAIMAEATRSKNIVLLFEEIQGVTGITSGREGSVDLGGVLASMLSKTGILCLATATPEGYKDSLEGKALSQSFERVDLSEPGIDEAIQVVESRVGMAEYRYQVFYSYDAVERLVELSDKFIRDRFLPKKALAVLDELSLYVREHHGKGYIMKGADVESYMAARLNLPVENVGAAESDVLLNLEDRIHERLIDQEAAVHAVADAMRRAKAKVRDVKRPVASFLFLGPTGVGKTELAKALAAVYYGDEHRMVRLDMTEYRDPSSALKLIGSGHERGVLTESIRTNPFALLLLDEFEKAHQEVINIFLQVFDDARLTDGAGKTVDFTNVIVIATSNAGANYIQEAIAAGTNAADMERTLLEHELRPFYPPELLNRFDGVIVFRPLLREHVVAIARLMLRQAADQLLKEHGVTLEVDPQALDELVTAGFDPAFGARPLRRVIQNTLDAELAKLILGKQLGRRDVVHLEPGGVLRVQKAARL